jgi:hypothetical protein
MKSQDRSSNSRFVSIESRYIHIDVSQAQIYQPTDYRRKLDSCYRTGYTQLRRLLNETRNEISRPKPQKQQTM